MTQPENQIPQLLQSSDLSTIFQSGFFHEDTSGLGFGALTCKDCVARALFLRCECIGCGTLEGSNGSKIDSNINHLILFLVLTWHDHRGAT